MSVIYGNTINVAGGKNGGGTHNDYYSMSLSIEEGTPNINTNKSTITIYASFTNNKSWTAWIPSSGVPKFRLSIYDDYTNEAKVYETTISRMNANTTLTLFDFSLDLEHKSDGSLNIFATLSVERVSNDYYYPYNTTMQTGGKALSTIPRASKLNNTGSFYLQDGFKIDYTSYSSSFYQKIKLTLKGTNKAFITTAVDNGGQLSYSNDTFNYFMESFPTNSDRATFVAELFTYLRSNNNLIGTDTKELIGIIKPTSNTIPTITGQIVVDETNSVISDLTNKQVYIKGFSNLKVTLSTLPTTKYNSTLNRLVLNDNYIMNILSNSAEYTINNLDTSNIKIEAFDSRNLKSFITSSVEIIEDYQIPQITRIRVDRTNGVEETAYLSFNASLWKGNFGNGSNTLTECKYRVKKLTSSTYSDWFDITGAVKVAIANQEVDNLSASNIQIFSNGVDTNFTFGEEYDVQVYIKDGITNTKFNSSGNIPVRVDDGLVLDHYVKNEDGYQIAFNGMVDKSLPNGVQINGSLHLNGDKVLAFRKIREIADDEIE